MAGDADLAAAAGRVAYIGHTLACFAVVAGIFTWAITEAAAAIDISAEFVGAVRFAAFILVADLVLGATTARAGSVVAWAAIIIFDVVIGIVVAEMAGETAGFRVFTGA